MSIRTKLNIGLYSISQYGVRIINEAVEKPPNLSLFDIVEITMSVVNELVNCYRDKVEESFGYVLVGLENVSSGVVRIHAIFSAGYSDVPWVCLGSGSSYARPLVELLLAEGNLHIDEAAKAMTALFTLVSNVQTTVGGGVDICIIKDEQGTGNIVHEKEINLERLRQALLSATGIKP